MRQLDERAGARVEVYRDTYYDRPDGSLEKADQELRVRTVHGADSTRTVLTFEDAAVDVSGAMPLPEIRSVGDLRSALSRYGFPGDRERFEEELAAAVGASRTNDFEGAAAVVWAYQHRVLIRNSPEPAWPRVPRP
jgi:hypothetical protein